MWVGDVPLRDRFRRLFDLLENKLLTVAQLRGIYFDARLFLRSPKCVLVVMDLWKHLITYSWVTISLVLFDNCFEIDLMFIPRIRRVLRIIFYILVVYQVMPN